MFITCGFHHQSRTEMMNTRYTCSSFPVPHLWRASLIFLGLIVQVAITADSHHWLPHGIKLSVDLSWRILKSRTGKMARLLRALAIVAQDPPLFHSTSVQLMTIHNSIANTLLWPPPAPGTHTVHRHAGRQSTHELEIRIMNMTVSQPAKWRTYARPHEFSPGWGKDSMKGTGRNLSQTLPSTTKPEDYFEKHLEDISRNTTVLLALWPVRTSHGCSQKQPG